MGNWSQLHTDVLELISRKINTLDLIRFSGVCHSWRLVGKQQRCRLPARLPGLMIAGSNSSVSQTRRFLVFPDDQSKNLQELQTLPVPHQDTCRGSYERWLLMVTPFMEIYLINPFSGSRIFLPSAFALQPYCYAADRYGYNCCIRWAALSKCPSSGSECTVLIHYTDNALAFCKLGDKCWKLVDSEKGIGYSKALYYRQKFYLVDWKKRICECDLNATPPVLTQLTSPAEVSHSQSHYLGNIGGELVRITREKERQLADIEMDENSSDTEDDDEDLMDEDILNDYSQAEFCEDFPPDAAYYRDPTVRFTLSKFNLETKEWIPLTGLGNYALFLGFNGCTALSELEVAGIKGNHIYFTDDNISGHMCTEPGDTGIYNLEDSTIEPLYFTGSALVAPYAVWVTPIPW